MDLKIDTLDLQIIEILKGNGRMQNNEIAARLSISEGTVRNRVKKMIDNQFLSIKGLVNASLLKEKQIFFLGIQISDSTKLEQAASVLAQSSAVSSVCMVTGRYDLLVEVLIEPFNLLNFLSADMAKIDCVATTESFMTLKSYNKWI
ncbi:MAG: winged helix-turn-helix transcriptional regulator [Chitinivibrionales bacterium]|nr:winged helix-turn-helix transcriptional regulator [Chitinivibrionales bacterium]